MRKRKRRGTYFIAKGSYVLLVGRDKLLRGVGHVEKDSRMWREEEREMGRGFENKVFNFSSTSWAGLVLLVPFAIDDLMISVRSGGLASATDSDTNLDRTLGPPPS